MALNVSDVSSEVWEAMASIVDMDFDSLSATPIFKRFQDLLSSKSVCMVNAASALPVHSVARLPERSWYVEPIDAYMFTDVDATFHGIAEMFVEYGDASDPRRDLAMRCLSKMYRTVDVFDVADELSASVW